MTDTDDEPRSLVDGSGRVLPANPAGVQQRRQLDEQEWRESPPFTWLGEKRRVKEDRYGEVGWYTGDDHR